MCQEFLTLILYKNDANFNGFEDYVPKEDKQGDDCTCLGTGRLSIIFAYKWWLSKYKSLYGM